MANEQRIIIDIEVNEQKAQDNISLLVQRLQSLSTERGNLTRQLKALQAEEATLAQTQGQLIQRLAQMRIAGEENTDTYRELSGQVALADSRLSELGNEAGRVASELSANAQTTRDARRELGLLQRESSAIPGSLNAQRAELVRLNQAYDNFSVGVSGSQQDLRQLERQIQQLTANISDQEQATGRFQRNVGNYTSALKGAFSGAIPGAALLTGGLVAGVGAATTALVEGAAAAVEIAKQYRNFRGEVQQLSGLTGRDLDGVTERVAALANTFGKDFNEVLIAANASAKQFGITLPDALAEIENGFLAGNDVNGEYLQSLREYPALLAEVGLSLEETNALINTQVTQGVYSDKGIDTIKEAGIALRELTPATRLALDGIGISSVGVQNALADGTKTVFDVIQEVSAKLSELPPQSAAVGTAIADVFKGAGEDAGLQYLQTLKDIDLTMEGTIALTNDLVRAQVAQLEANQELSRAQNELSRNLDGLIGGTETFGTRLKTFGIEVLNQFLQAIQPITSAAGELFVKLGEAGRALGIFEKGAAAGSIVGKALAFTFEQTTKGVRGLLGVLNFLVDSLRSAYTNFAIVRNGVDLVIAGFQSVSQTVGELPAIFAGSLASATRILQNFKAGVLESLGGLKDIVAGILDFDSAKIQSGFDAAKSGIINAVTGIGDGAGDAYASAFSERIMEIPTTAEAAGKAAAEALEGAALSDVGVSVQELTTKLSDLQKKFAAAKTDAERTSIAATIKDVEKELETLQKPLAKALAGNQGLKDLQAYLKAELLGVEGNAEEELRIRRELIRVASQEALANEKLTAGERVLIAAEAQREIEALEQGVSTNRLEAQKAEIETRLIQAKAGTDAEFSLRQELVKKNGEIELQAEGLTAEARALIRAQSAQEIQEIENERIQALIDSELQAFDIEEANLRVRLASKLLTEEEYSEQLYEIRAARLEAEIAQLEEGELAKIEKEAELAELRAERLISITEAENQARVSAIAIQEEEARKQGELSAVKLGIAQDTTDAIISLLGKEVQESKAVTAAKKLVAAAEVGISLQRQLAAIRLAAAKIAIETVPTIPVGAAASAAYRTINTIGAVVGAAAALARIAAFEKGGPTQFVGSHAAGGIVGQPSLGLIGEAGTEWVGPNWMLKNPKLAPVFGQLEKIRQMKYVPFAEGGFSGVSSSIPNIPDGGFVARQAERTIFDPKVLQEAVRSGFESAPAPRVLVDDIERGQRRKAVVESAGNT